MGVARAGLLGEGRQSILPSSYAVTDMGYADYGGGARAAQHGAHGGVSVAELTALAERFRLASGRQLNGYTLNHRSPGLELRAVQGQLVEVRLVNELVPRGITLHWHGLDITALSHVYSGIATVNGYDREQRISAPPGVAARVRLINTDNGVVSVWVQGAPYRVLAVDGYDLNGPSSVAAQQLQVPAGGRADLAITVPADGSAVRVDVGGAAALVIGGAAGAALPPTAAPRSALDLLSYGTPGPLPFDPARADRRFRYDIGRRPGFVHGRPGMWWSINGRLYPDVPMFMVDRGDVVRMTIRNRSGHAHPMHLHGHHAVVLSRNGVEATGSPWWVDSLEVASGDEYEVAFLADNPGIWMDHCHNLPHAQQGLVAHLMYSGVTEPYRLGRGTPNEPE